MYAKSKSFCKAINVGIYRKYIYCSRNFISIITGATPLKEEPWGLANQMTAKSLAEIGAIGGPRCCKRDSYLSIIAATKFVKEKFGVEMEMGDIYCIHSENNNQCIGIRCPFFKK